MNGLYFDYEKRIINDLLSAYNTRGCLSFNELTEAERLKILATLIQGCPEYLAGWSDKYLFSVAHGMFLDYLSKSGDQSKRTFGRQDEKEFIDKMWGVFSYPTSLAQAKYGPEIDAILGRINKESGYINKALRSEKQDVEFSDCVYELVRRYTMAEDLLDERFANLDADRRAAVRAWLTAFLCWHALFIGTQYWFDTENELFLSDVNKFVSENKEKCLSILSDISRNDNFVPIGKKISSYHDSNKGEVFNIGYIVAVIFDNYLSAGKDNYLMSPGAAWAQVRSVITGRKEDRDAFISEIIRQNFSVGYLGKPKA